MQNKYVNLNGIVSLGKGSMEYNTDFLNLNFTK